MKGGLLRIFPKNNNHNKDDISPIHSVWFIRNWSIRNGAQNFEKNKEWSGFKLKKLRNAEEHIFSFCNKKEKIYFCWMNLQILFIYFVGKALINLLMYLLNQFISEIDLETVGK